MEGLVGVGDEGARGGDETANSTHYKEGIFY